MYKIDYTVQEDNARISDSIRRECTFVLASNDLSISGEQMLREYKTQSDVEKTFQKLKSPTFMNSVFLKTPERVEAVVYLLLIALMVLTIAEKIVRKGLEPFFQASFQFKKLFIKPVIPMIIAISLAHL